MKIRSLLAVFLGQIIIKLSRLFKLGAGATWPGEVALWVDPKIIKNLIPADAKVIVVAGTNGKTTTSKMIVSLIKTRVVYNETGANLLNGIAATLVKNYFKKKPDYYVFEVDEGALPLVLNQVKPFVLVLMNLFRDQLDRYGETDKIVKNWINLSNWTNLVVNADDPQLAFIGQKFKENVYFFGLDNKELYLDKIQHATDSIYCPNCQAKLRFEGIYFSHLGDYKCPKCRFEHPKNDRTSKGSEGCKGSIEGIYNFYNVLAAELTGEILGIKTGLKNFEPAFGRGEEIDGTKILLSKNPAGFNESLRTVINSSKEGAMLLALNDRIPDGRDISWIWDVDFEMLKNYDFPIYVSGDRALDLALRLKYADIKVVGEVRGVGEIKEKISWILATYSAMLDIRKELTGRKIL